MYIYIIYYIYICYNFKKLFSDNDPMFIYYIYIYILYTYIYICYNLKKLFSDNPMFIYIIYMYIYTVYKTYLGHLGI